MPITKVTGAAVNFTAPSNCTWKSGTVATSGATIGVGSNLMYECKFNNLSSAASLTFTAYGGEFAMQQGSSHYSHGLQSCTQHCQ